MVYWFSYLTLSLLCSALLCYALLCLGWYQLLCLWVHPLWKQSGFIVVFPVCTLGAPRRIKERFHLCLCLVWPLGLAQPYHGGETWSLLCLMLCFDLMMILSLCYAKVLRVLLVLKPSLCYFWKYVMFCMLTLENILFCMLYFVNAHVCTLAYDFCLLSCDNSPPIMIIFFRWCGESKWGPGLDWWTCLSWGDVVRRRTFDVLSFNFFEF